jgi:hypothetical protein
VYEVTLDADGVAQRVPKGQGTHFIHISPNNETHLEEKVISAIKFDIYLTLFFNIYICSLIKFPVLYLLITSILINGLHLQRHHLIINVFIQLYHQQMKKL